VVSVGEENLLCLPGDAYPDQIILVQMLAHGLRNLGIVDVDTQFQSRLQAAYNAGMDSGLWTGTWATDSPNDYWAMGGQTWFGVNTRVPVQNRTELMTCDPALAALLASWLPADDWQPGCY
jgi:ABC-type transport system substrate-binding protein